MVLRAIVSDTGGSILGQLDASSNPSYYLGDALGSVRGTSDMTGTLTGSADYDVFGPTRSSGGALPAFRFTGEQTDAETGALFLRARYYGPGAGRFMSADSVMPNAPGTQGYNLYAYGANNPARWVDPSGHDPAVIGLPFFTGPTLEDACLLAAQTCGTALNIGFQMVNSAAGYLADSSTIVGKAAWVVATAGTEVVMFALIMCALDISAAVQPDGTIGWGGCAGLAHRLQELINNNGSPGPVVQRVTQSPPTTYPAQPKVTPPTVTQSYPPPPPLTPNCGSFSASTLVATDSGETRIGSLHVGDHVLAWDQASDTTGSYSVSAVLVHVDPVVEELTVDGETLETTPEHPFYIEESGWVAAGDLRRGEHIYRADGSLGARGRRRAGGAAGGHVQPHR